jgi:hypothetical protein
MYYTTQFEKKIGQTTILSKNAPLYAIEWKLIGIFAQYATTDRITSLVIHLAVCVLKGPFLFQTGVSSM